LIVDLVHFGHFDFFFFLIKKIIITKTNTKCRGIGPRSPLFMYVLGLRPKPRTRDLPRRVKRYQRNMRLVLVIMAQKGKPRTNVT